MPSTGAARNRVPAWREHIARHLPDRSPATLLDIGAGAGYFAAAFTDWFDADVLAVEPHAATRAKIPTHPRIHPIDSRAEQLSLPDDCADLAWLSGVIHHTHDLDALAAELYRTLRPGAPVLIRDVFPERCAHRPVVRFFPESRRRIDTYPTLAATRTAFAAAGFHERELITVAEWHATDLTEFTATTAQRRTTDGLLRVLTDREYERGMQRLRTAPPQAPLLDHLNLLVLIRQEDS